MRFVLDASIALGWAIDRPVPAIAAKVLGELQSGDFAIVPALWHLEIASALAVAERRGTLDRLAGDFVLQGLAEMLRGPIETHPDVIMLGRALVAARTLGLTPYDATYVLVAQELGLPLATLDKTLREGAIKAGVKLYH